MDLDFPMIAEIEDSEWFPEENKTKKTVKVHKKKIKKEETKLDKEKLNDPLESLENCQPDSELKEDTKSTPEEGRYRSIVFLELYCKHFWH